MKYEGTEVSFESVADLRRQYGAQINTLELIKTTVKSYQNNNTNKKLVSKIMKIVNLNYYLNYNGKANP